MKARARFHIEEEDFLGTRVVLRDVGPHDCYPTITNDAEAVFAQLVAEERVRADTSLLYYDSAGELTRIVHDGERFLGFAPAAPGEP